MKSSSETGIVKRLSCHSVDQTIEKLKQMLAARGIKLFAVIDHSGEAEIAGLSMKPTKVLIFGNPKAGTPIMQAAPSAAIDLPLKLLVTEDDAGDVWIYSNSAAYLQERHGFPAGLLPNIAAAEALAEAVAN
jgi:uncharacterized protein (DUF302 family)